MLCLAVLKLYKTMHSWQKIKESNPSEIIQQPGRPPSPPPPPRPPALLLGGVCVVGALLLLLFSFGNERRGLMEAVRNLASADEASVAQSGLLCPREGAPVPVAVSGLVQAKGD